MKIRKMIPNINRHLTPEMDVIEPGELSHEGLIVPEIVMQYGSFFGKLRDFLPMFPTMLRLIREVKRSYLRIGDQPLAAKTQISPADMDDFLALAESLEIDGIGYTTVDRNFIFKDKKILYPHAIVLTMEMKKEKIQLAPSQETLEEIMRSYYGLTYAANQLTDFLKSRGYCAEAGPALGGEVNYPLLAEKAGLGAIGKHGLLITPEFGPSLRIGVVLTEIENLPFNVGNEHLWIKEFCDLCNRCVRKCPVGAIYKKPIIFADGSEEHIDYKKCAVPFSKQKGCTVCVKECTFFREGYPAVQTRMEKIKANQKASCR